MNNEQDEPMIKETNYNTPKKYIVTKKINKSIQIKEFEHNEMRNNFLKLIEQTPGR